MLNTFSHQGNANQNHSEMPFTLTRMDTMKKTDHDASGEDVQKLEPSRGTDEAMKMVWPLGTSLAVPEKLKWSYFTTSLFRSYAYTQKKGIYVFTLNLLHNCSCSV